MVVDGAQVEAVLLGDDGVATRAAEGTLCVDMSTIAPGADAPRSARRSTSAGIGFVDAPVTGSSPKAEDGTLTIMAGGTAADFARARPLLRGRWASSSSTSASSARARCVKLINNAVAAANASTLAQALIVGKATGVDLDALVRGHGRRRAAAARCSA